MPLTHKRCKSSVVRFWLKLPCEQSPGRFYFQKNLTPGWLGPRSAHSRVSGVSCVSCSRLGVIRESDEPSFVVGASLKPRTVQSFMSYGAQQWPVNHIGRVVCLYLYWLSVDNLPGVAYSYWKENMGRRKHSKKDVEAALKYAESQGWKVEVGGSHAWGKIYCPYNDAECRCGEFCIACVWSTPRSPSNHARAIKQVVDNCTAHKAKQRKNKDSQ